MSILARLAFVLLVAAVASPTAAQDAEQGKMILEAIVDVQANGDARWSVVARFHPEDFPPIVATWGTSMTEDLRTGQTVKYEMIMVISRREGSSVHRATLHWVHDVPDRSGRMVPVKVDLTMEGKATDGTLVLTGQKKTMTFLTTGKVFTMNKDIATFRITPDGLLQGKLGNDKEGYGEGVWGRR